MISIVLAVGAWRNLLSEGLYPRWIALSGSPMLEVLTHYRADIDASGELHAVNGSTTPGMVRFAWEGVSGHLAVSGDGSRRADNP